MESVFVSGQFVNNQTGAPIDGPVRFTPSRMWADQDGVSYAILSPTVMTDKGRFRVRLTACHPREGDYGWHYQIQCPMGIWTCKPDGPEGAELSLKDLLPTRYT